MNRRKLVNTTTIGAGAAVITGLNACANNPEKSDQDVSNSANFFCFLIKWFSE